MGIDPLTLSIAGSVFSSFIGASGGLFGGGDDSPAPRTIQNSEPQVDEAAKAASAKKKKQQKQVAANSGSQNTFNPLSNDSEDVTAKTLLGL